MVDSNSVETVKKTLVISIYFPKRKTHIYYDKIMEFTKISSFFLQTNFLFIGHAKCTLFKLSESTFQIKKKKKPSIDIKLIFVLNW